MVDKAFGALTPTRGARDPFMLLRRMTTDLERAFDDWPSFRWPFGTFEPGAWSPKIDVFERDNRLVTRVDLPGVKKDDVSVEVKDGSLVLSGERKTETEEKKDNFYRSEREYGRFYRAVPLLEGVKVEDIKATFVDGVLEVAMPMPARPSAQVTKVKVEEPKTASKTAA